MQKLHEINLNFILKHKENIKGIIEIGSSCGILADKILSLFETSYTIIEPSFFGSVDNKIIINDFFENVDDNILQGNTILMSHVFEHFYKPLDIINKISKNPNIENIFLVFPDLEYYINNEILHVLNTEHTYYVDNDFLIGIFNNKGYRLVESLNHINHSVLFHFVKDTNLKCHKSIYNHNYDLNIFFDKIKNKVGKFNTILNNTDNVYIWPASVHSLFLDTFGFRSEKLEGYLDNSKNKIGKFSYNTGIPIMDFGVVNKDSKSTILINGGIFNVEIENIHARIVF